MVQVVSKRGRKPLSEEEKARRAALTPQQKAEEKQARKAAREAKVAKNTAGKQPTPKPSKPAAKPKPAKADKPAPKRQTVKENDPKTHVEDLTDDQHHSLFLQGVDKYQRALKVKKDADADLRNVGKLVKADLGSGALDEIKLYLRLQTDEGQSHLRALAEVQMRLARWSGMPVGHTDDLFGEDRTPIEDKAFALGKRDGLAGNAAAPPSSYSGPLIQKYMAGYEEGRAVNLAGIKQKPREFGSPPNKPATDWKREGIKAFEAGSSDTPPGDVPAEAHDDWRAGWAWAKAEKEKLVAAAPPPDEPSALEPPDRLDYWRKQGASARRNDQPGHVPDAVPEEFKEAWLDGWDSEADEYDKRFWKKKGADAWGQGHNGEPPEDVPGPKRDLWVTGWQEAKAAHEGERKDAAE